jgi:hypothetical protein
MIAMGVIPADRIDETPGRFANECFIVLNAPRYIEQQDKVLPERSLFAP